MDHARNARSIPYTGLMRASGNDRVAQNDEPERTFAAIEAQANAEARAIVRGDVDAAMHADKAADGYALRKLRSAIALERRQMDVARAIGGNGTFNAGGGF